MASAWLPRGSGLGAAPSGAGGAESPRSGSAARPNVLFIMSDDHAAHAVSCYGSKINKTPNIDRMALEGIRFASCFAVNSICTPSRAAILTGKYSHLNGVPVFNRFDGRQPTVQKYFKDAGYHTGIVGKWHLFSDPTGFDYWNVLPGQGLYHDPEMIENGVSRKLKGYATDLITDISIEFLKNRPRDKPFLLFSHHKAPHRPWEPDEKHAKLYEGMDIPEPSTFDDDYVGRSSAASEATMRIDRDLTPTDVKGKPPEGLSAEALKKWNYQRYIKDYLRCIASVDDNVGRLLEFLDASGLKENTLVLYTSDQGFFLGDHNWYDKRFMYEESIRMPLVLRLPGRVRPGAVCERMVLNVDFAPTLLELAGLPVPPDMQGRSFLPLLDGKAPPDWRTSMYYRYYHYPQDHRVQPHYGVRTERYKLIYFNKIDKWELYDLEKDPEELKNVYAEPSYAETVKGLKTEMERLKKELKDEDQFTGGETLVYKPDPTPLVLVLQPDFGAIEGESIPDASGKGHGLQGSRPENPRPGGSRPKAQSGGGEQPEARKLESAAGRRKPALRLDGAEAATLSPLPASLDPAAKTFTAGAWCRPEAADGVLIAMGGASHGFSLYIEGGVPHFAIRHDGELFEVSGSRSLKTGEWAHVAAVLGADGKARLFVGAKPACDPKDAGAIARKPADGLAIGADPGSRVGDYKTPLNFRGLIEDARLYWGELGEEALKVWAGD